MIVAQREHPGTPGAPRQTPDKEQLKKYLARGMTQQQIADAWFEETGTRVSRNAITMAMQREKLTPTNPQPRYSDLLPWRVKVEHIRHYDARMLRAESRIRRKRSVKAKKADPDYERVESWKQTLTENSAVVLYDGLTEQGFFWVPREPTDDDLIRRPEAG